MRVALLAMVLAACGSDETPCAGFPAGHSCCLSVRWVRGGCLPGLECFYTGPGVAAECLQPCGGDGGACAAGVECRMHFGGAGDRGCFCTLPGDTADRSDGGVCP